MFYVILFGITFLLGLMLTFVMDELAAHALLKEKNKTAALHCALKNLHLLRASVVKQLLDEGADVNQIGLFGATPLIVAVYQKRSLAVIKELIAAGAHLNAENNSMKNPLIAAIARRNSLPVVRELLSRSDVSKICLNDGSNLLTIAATFYHRPVLLDDIKKICPDVNATNYEGITALIAAANMGKSAANIKKLLAFGADKTLKDCQGKTAYDYFKKNYHLFWHIKLGKQLNPVKALDENIKSI